VQQPATINVFTDPEARCYCVSDHNPNVVVFERHHIWPLGMGGPDDPSNIELLCPTTHMSVHHLLRAWFKYDVAPDWDVARHFSFYTRTLARRGYERWVAAGRPALSFDEVDNRQQT
jgi:hypothetical protein